MEIIHFLLTLLQSGLGNLAAYLAAQVLLCLAPAFFIAGALTALVPKEAVTRYLGRTAPKFISYPASAIGGFVLAVCSCTIMPLFAGIYKKGAGLGPAITFLFVGPAINILALAYTGVAIGMDIAIARATHQPVFGAVPAVVVARGRRPRLQPAGIVASVRLCAGHGGCQRGLPRLARDGGGRLGEFAVGHGRLPGRRDASTA